MPIDPNVISAELPVLEHSWTQDDIILYHLGLGAGADWLNPRELEYTYEKSLKVLPSFAVIPPHKAVPAVVGLPGMDFKPHMIVHGEHEIIVAKRIPTSGTVETRTKVAGVYERASGALVVIENVSRLKGEDDPLFTNRWSLFVRGEVGHGPEPDPRPPVIVPDRAPDIVQESPLLPQLAQIYRLSGDKEKFHIDPEIAKLAGFDKPLLMGLCTFGIVCKAVVDGALDGDTEALASFRGRFAKPVFCGETLVTKIWRESGELIVHTDAKERGVAVFASSVAVPRS